MILGFVILYLLLSLSIGLYAATGVRTTKDFAVAGRSLPLPIVTATVFATWFGAETVFGISATFVKEGLRGVVADPFGSSLCLILAGLFFARRLYRLNLLTIGDYYRLRYNRTVEVLCTLCIVASYLGWVSAQIKALGLVFHVVSDGAVNQTLGMVIGAAIVLTYTTFGGMFAVAILDFVQNYGDHGGHGVHRFHDQPTHRWGGGRHQPCRGGGEARVLSACRFERLDFLHRRMDDDDARFNPSAGRVSAHDISER